MVTARRKEKVSAIFSLIALAVSSCPFYGNESADGIWRNKEFANKVSIIYFICPGGDCDNIALDFAYEKALDGAIGVIHISTSGDALLDSNARRFIKELLRAHVSQILSDSEPILLRDYVQNALAESSRQIIRGSVTGNMVSSLEIPKSGYARLDAATNAFIYGVLDRYMAMPFGTGAVVGVANHMRSLVSYTASVGDTASNMLIESAEQLRRLSDRQGIEIAINCDDRTAFSMSHTDIEIRIRELENKTELLEKEYDTWYAKWPSTREVEMKLLRISALIDTKNMMILKLHRLIEKLSECSK